MTTEFNIEIVPGAQKAAVAGSAAGRKDLHMVPWRRLKVIPGFNVRDLSTPENKAHVAALSQSMIEEGFFADKPLAVIAIKDGKKDVLAVTDGHCRLAAIEAAVAGGAEIENIPVVLAPAGTTLEDLMVRMARGNTGKTLTPLETAELAYRLQSRGITDKEIARRIGITSQYLGQLMTLRSAPAAIRKLVAAGKLSAKEAVAQIKTKGTEAVAAVETAVAKAEATGKKKVTSKDIDGPKTERKKREKLDPTNPAEKDPLTITEEFAFRKGQRLDIEKIAKVRNLAGGDWWALNEDPDRIDILTNITFEIRVKKEPLPSAENDPLEGLD